MPIPKTSKKGLQSILTLRNRSNIRMQPHRVYSRISAIEMEKTRKQIEKTAMQNRIKEIDERFLELEREKDYLLQLIGERSAVEPIQQPKKKPRIKELHPKNPLKGQKKNPEIKERKKRTTQNHVSRILKQSKPEPLKPLPEYTGGGLKIKY